MERGSEKDLMDIDKSLPVVLAREENYVPKLFDESSETTEKAFEPCQGRKIGSMDAYSEETCKTNMTLATSPKQCVGDLDIMQHYTDKVSLNVAEYKQNSFAAVSTATKDGDTTDVSPHKQVFAESEHDNCQELEQNSKASMNKATELCESQDSDSSDIWVRKRAVLSAA